MATGDSDHDSRLAFEEAVEQSRNWRIEADSVSVTEVGAISRAAAILKLASSEFAGSADPRIVDEALVGLGVAINSGYEFAEKNEIATSLQKAVDTAVVDALRGIVESDHQEQGQKALDLLVAAAGDSALGHRKLAEKGVVNALEGAFYNCDKDKSVEGLAVMATSGNPEATRILVNIAVRMPEQTYGHRANEELRAMATRGDLPEPARYRAQVYVDARRHLLI